MSIPELVYALAEAGASSQAIAIAVKAVEEAQIASLSRRRLDVGISEWLSLREEVFQRDGFRCVYCGAPDDDPQCDHVLPLIHGGVSILSNLATACRPCNSSKGGKLLSDWRGRL
jgi:5-methylcytosine-specific restriction endonuclease McrA